MNNLVKDTGVLHNLWGCVKYKIYKNNLILVLIPLIYVAMVLLTLPEPGVEVVKYSYISLDSYKTISLTTEDKLNIILDKYNLTKEQFNVLKAIVLSEADNCYDDAYAVINTIYNRAHSKNWVRSVNNRFGSGKGSNLYYQAIAPGQFTVYSSGSYKKYLNNTSREGYKAIIDFLYTEDIMHNYLSFRSHSIKIKGSVAFSTKGNNYFNVLKEENRI